MSQRVMRYKLAFLELMFDREVRGLSDEEEAQRAEARAEIWETLDEREQSALEEWIEARLRFVRAKTRAQDAQVRDREAAVHAAYQQRNRVAILAAALARALGFRSGIYQDPAEPESRYATVLQIDLPTGQVTFHLDLEDDWTILSPDWDIHRDYDGHDEIEKWKRIEDFVRQWCVRSNDDAAIASFRASVERLERALDEERKQHLAKGELFVEARQDYKRLHFAVQELRRLAVRGDPVGHVSPLFSTDGIDPGAGLGDLYRRFDEIWEHAKKLADAKIRESEDAEDVP